MTAGFCGFRGFRGMGTEGHQGRPDPPSTTTQGEMTITPELLDVFQRPAEHHERDTGTVEPFTQAELLAIDGAGQQLAGGAERHREHGGPVGGQHALLLLLLLGEQGRDGRVGLAGGEDGLGGDGEPARGHRIGAIDVEAFAASWRYRTMACWWLVVAALCAAVAALWTAIPAVVTAISVRARRPTITARRRWTVRRRAWLLT